MIYLGLAFLLVLGVAMIVWPEVMWKIDNFLWTKGGEPSDLYIVVMRISGAFFVLTAVFVAIARRTS